MAITSESASATMKVHENETLDNAREDTSELAKKKVFDVLVQRAVGKFRAAMTMTESITSRDVREYEALSYSDSGWERVGKSTYEERIKVIRDAIDNSIPEMIQEIRTLEGKFHGGLAKAVEKGWISRDSAQEWTNRLRSGDIPHWEKINFMKDTFPSFLENWKNVAEKREDVLKLAQSHKLTAKDIPELANLFNQNAFHGLDYLNRKDFVSKAKALILAHSADKKRFLGFVQDELKSAVSEGYLHTAKVGEWMERVMTSGDPEKFASTVLWPFLRNWKAVKEDFDRLNDALDNKGIPRGFRPVKDHDFLLMNYKQRTSYCALAWLRLDDAGETDKQLAGLKLRIRHDLDMEDWEGAEEELTAAFALRADDRELKSMQDFLESHRPEKTEKADEDAEEPDPLPVVENMRAILSQIPAGTLKSCYEEALLAGPAVFHRFAQVSANHAWVVEHGYASEAENIKNAQDEFNKQKTREYAQRGHSKQLERNIVKGDTATGDAIRDDCTQAQMLYVEGDGKNAVMQKVRDNVDNESFGYWTTLVPMDVSFSVHNNVIKNLHYPLKQGLRELGKMGYRFTLAGNPEKSAA